MGLFDFPRIHFGGNININVPTINNAYYFPLTIYDATRSKAYLPPRLYFSSSSVIQSVPSSLNPPVFYDEVNGYYYIQIEPINTIEILRKWCMSPLGTNPESPDAAYFPYYIAADNDLGPVESSFIVGNCPGYWNMFGDMGVTMSDVSVTGLQIFDGTSLNTWTLESQNIPPDVTPLLDANFDLNTAPASGITTALMVETISSQSVYANIFCSNINLFDSANPENVFIQGKPCRFSALIYSAWRVINWMPAMAGSARFCASIPMEDISQGEQATLIQFFNNNKAYDSRPLLGVFVTFTVFEVFENRYDQNFYLENGPKSNPAQATTIGSITPWYKDDMRSGVLGRNLISLGMNPIYTNSNSIPNAQIKINLTPAISSLKDLGNGTAIFSVDMGNSWPEFMTPQYSPVPPLVLPALRGDANFETANLGALIFTYNTDSSSEFARINIDPTNNPRTNIFTNGGIFDFLISDPTIIQNIQSNLILGFLNSVEQVTQVLTEAEYMITSDQKGLYGEQYQFPSDGYLVYDGNVREPCKIRIFQKGLPVTQPIQVAVAEYIIPEGANDPLAGPDKVEWQNLSDNSIVNLVNEQLTLKNNAVYYFVYSGQYNNNQIPIFNQGNYTVMDTGSFVCLRVHPFADFGKYIDPAHVDYTPPVFEFMYDAVFKMYDVAYPVMAHIHPFTAEVWNNGTMAGLAVQRSDPKYWNDILYMPRSRELGIVQLALLRAWAKYLAENESK